MLRVKKDAKYVRYLSDGMDSIVPVVGTDYVLYQEISNGRQS